MRARFRLLIAVPVAAVLCIAVALGLTAAFGENTASVLAFFLCMPIGSVASIWVMDGTRLAGGRGW